MYEKLALEMAEIRRTLPCPAMKLDRATIEAALAAMNARLQAAEVTGEICIFGGTVTVLAFDARQATRDEGYDTPGDGDDAKFLARHLGLRTPAQVFEIVGRYYAAERLVVKTRYFIEEIMQELSKE